MMVTVAREGFYYKNGGFVPTSADPAHMEEGRKGTMAYGILHAHNENGDMAHLKLRFDAMASHDITYVGIVQTARASGLQAFPCPLRAHQLPQLPVRRGRHHQRGRPPLRPLRRKKVWRGYLCLPIRPSSTPICGSATPAPAK